MPPASLPPLAGDEPGTDDGEEQQQRGSASLSRTSFIGAAQSAMPQHRDHVVGGDDAGEPAVLVDDGEREQVVFVEQRGDLVLRRVGRAGDVRLARARDSWTAGEEIAIFTSGTAPTSLCPGPGQVDRGQRFAAALERLQRLDRVVDDRRFPGPR